ncbi:hypothetical protein OF846_004699 [Rhodotorula toruloides]|nr:hypothetical protein OF846_004699 [Rhodotorula toruloides]
MLVLLRSTARATPQLFARPLAVTAFRWLTSAATPPLATLQSVTSSKFRRQVEEACGTENDQDASRPIVAKVAAGLALDEWEAQVRSALQPVQAAREDKLLTAIPCKGLDSYELCNSRTRYVYSGEIEPLTPGQEVDNHPLFCFLLGLHHLAAPTIRAAEQPVVIYTIEKEAAAGDSVTFLRGNIYEDPAIDELATYPACTKLKLKFMEDDAGVVENPKGVTVRQLLDLARHYFNTPLTEEETRYARRCLSRRTGDVVRIGDCLPRVCSFMRSFKVEQDGSVLAEYTWYDDRRTQKQAKYAQPAQRTEVEV